MYDSSRSFGSTSHVERLVTLDATFTAHFRVCLNCWQSRLSLVARRINNALLLAAKDWAHGGRLSLDRAMSSIPKGDITSRLFLATLVQIVLRYLVYRLSSPT
jgi:hypothetical protein